MKIAHWARFQGYKKRGPEWIKLHLSLLDQPEYLRLPLVARAVLPALWLTAARVSEAGELPDDLELLATLSHVAQVELQQALEPLRLAGFLVCDKPVAGLPTQVSGEERESRGEREQRRFPVSPSAPPGDARARARDVWSVQACDDWINRYGGVAPGGQIGKSLKPLVDKHGWPAVRQAWRAYLEETEARFASAGRFAATYGRWSGAAPDPAGAKATVGEHNAATLRRVIARLDDGDQGQAEVAAGPAGAGRLLPAPAK
jgi:hypothetical protein